jgi:hypothetical protein
MAKATKAKGRYGTTGRVTPKKDAAVETVAERREVEENARYTAPIPREWRESPKWVPVLMFTFLALGALMIIVNYTPLMPGGSSNWYLLGGLGLVTLGFITATKWE